MEYFSKNDIINYAYYILNTAKMERIDIDGSTYHHNTDYQAGIWVVAHVNGIDKVSLSVAGLQDLYKGEEYLKKIENSESINEIFSLVEKINSLLDIATTIKNSNILLREVSFNQNEQLDARKLSRLPRINNIGGMKC